MHAQLTSAHAVQSLAVIPMPSVPFSHLSREELDVQFSPSRSAKDPWGVLRRHGDITSSLEHAPDLAVTRDLAYGARPSQCLDLVVPRGRGPHPCVAWFHGGFWQEGSKAGSGFAAHALAAHGIALAGVGYTLTPTVRLGDIVGEAGEAIRWLSEQAPAYGVDPAGILVAGHSAGAHLAAAIVAGMAGEAAASAVAGAVLVSGVYDLAPVAASYVNDLAWIDDDEVARLSPLRATPSRDIPVHVLIGADEPDQFQRQTAALVDHWRHAITSLSVHVAPGRDHFDVLDELTQPASPTLCALREMIT